MCITSSYFQRMVDMVLDPQGRTTSSASVWTTPNKTIRRLGQSGPLRGGRSDGMTLHRWDMGIAKSETHTTHVCD